MDSSLYRDQENWGGSYYELAIELQPAGNHARLLSAIRRLWAHPALRGPWPDRASVGDPCVIGGDLIGDWFDPSDPVPMPLYGTLMLPDRGEIGCNMHAVREEGTGGSDWLDLSLPTGMLGRFFPVAYPLHDEPNPWLNEIDGVFVSVAEWLYEQVPFEQAIVGEEVSGLVSAKELSREHLTKNGHIIPQQLWDRLNPTCSYRQLSCGLRFIPRQCH